MRRTKAGRYARSQERVLEEEERISYTKEQWQEVKR